MNFVKALSSKSLLLFLLLLTMLFLFYLFPRFQEIKTCSDCQQIELLDTKLNYSFDDVTKLLGGLNEEELSRTKFITGRLDMIYPVVYGSFLILLMLTLTKNLKRKQWSYLVILPLAGVLFDYSENYHILEMLENPKLLTPEQVKQSATMTTAKWGLLISSSALIVVLGAYRIYRSLRYNQV